MTTAGEWAAYFASLDPSLPVWFETCEYGHGVVWDKDVVQDEATPRIVPALSVQNAGYGRYGEPAPAMVLDVGGLGCEFRK